MHYLFYGGPGCLFPMLTRILTMKLTDITEQKSEDKMKYKLPLKMNTLPGRGRNHGLEVRSQQE